ncbi:MAG: hypothetical protein VYC94_04845 [Cyanobacteriota bacterium]|nr:hypothetical protein [Cyanobacteriota bacterium]
MTFTVYPRHHHHHHRGRSPDTIRNSPFVPALTASSKPIKLRSIVFEASPLRRFRRYHRRYRRRRTSKLGLNFGFVIITIVLPTAKKGNSISTLTSTKPARFFPLHFPFSLQSAQRISANSEIGKKKEKEKATLAPERTPLRTRGLHYCLRFLNQFPSDILQTRKLTKFASRHPKNHKNWIFASINPKIWMSMAKSDMRHVWQGKANPQ